MSHVRERFAAFAIVLIVVAGVAGGLFLFVRPYFQPPAVTSQKSQAKVVARPQLGVWGRDELVRMAARLEPADVSQRTIMPPPLELTRQNAELSESNLSAGVRIVTGFECSVPLTIRRLSDTHFALRIETPGLRNWFMFRVEGVPAGGKTVRIDLDRVDLGKWRTLNPVYSYCARLDDVAAFEAKPAAGKPTAAYNGPLIPDTSGQQWHYIPAVWSQGADRLCFVQHFDHDAYIAMRVPYTPKYNDAYLASLAGNPYAKVITLGRSPQGRLLQLVKISNGEEAERKNPCVFMYAREHPDEPDASWAIQGAIKFLTSDDSDAAKLRHHFTFLFLPVYDPDGAAAGLYERISYSFTPNNPPPEVLDYANWFEKWVDAGKRLDVVLDLHNMESGEMEHLACYFADQGRLQASRDIHSAILRRFDGGNGSPYFVARMLGKPVYLTNRLGGWLGFFYGPVSMLYEMDSQEKHQHLSMSELHEFGDRLTSAICDTLTSPRGAVLLSTNDALRKSRSARISEFGNSGGANVLVVAARLGWSSPAAIRSQPQIASGRYQQPGHSKPTVP